jgi:acetoacetyl-CoA synthetase
MPEIADSLIIGVEEPGGGYWMPLFVALESATDLDDGLRTRILDAIRTAASPRHVPDEVVQSPPSPHP